MLQPRWEEHQRADLRTDLHRRVCAFPHWTEQPGGISASELLRSELSLLAADIVKLRARGGIAAIIEVQHAYTMYAA
jgi:hypothetical protein